MISANHAISLTREALDDLVVGIYVFHRGYTDPLKVGISDVVDSNEIRQFEQVQSAFQLDLRDRLRQLPLIDLSLPFQPRK